MKPFFNSRRPKHYKQKGNTAPHNQQGFATNPSLANSMPMQPQLGLVNAQIPMPFNNANTLLSNGQPMPNMPPLITQQPGLLSGPNDLAILQLQNQVSKLNTLKMLMDQVNQLQGELFGPGFSNFPQLNQNMGLLQNPMQNMMNPVMPMQMPTTSQVGSYNVPSSSHQVVGAQSSNFYVNPPFGVEQQVNPNQQNFVMPTTGANGSKLLPVANQQVQGNSFASQQSQNFVMPTVGANGSNPLPVATQQVEGNLPASQQSEKFVMPKMAPNGSKPSPVATHQVQGNPSASQQSQNFQPSAYNRRQGNPAKNGHGSTPNSKWGNFSGKTFKNNPKREQSQSGYQKSEFHRMDNGKRKLGFSNEHSGKGHDNERAAKFGRSDPTNHATEKKRTLIYTEQEIERWRESRRKHFPTKTNIEKKQAEKLINSEVIDKEANFRRKQLKEILAKQAELGVEVAEIPPDYLLDAEKLEVEVAEIPPHSLLDSEKQGVEVAEILPHHLLDSEKQEHGREDNRRSLAKKRRFQNKHDRNGRYHKKGRLAKQLGSENEDRKPTLLEKLLGADIRRDKRHLLQVFRFMVVNSFFKDWPDKPLKFPSVAVKEDGCEAEPMEEKSSLVGDEVSEVRNNTTAEKVDIVDEVDRIEEGEIVD